MNPPRTCNVGWISYQKTIVLSTYLWRNYSWIYGPSDNSNKLTGISLAVILQELGDAGWELVNYNLYEETAKLATAGDIALGDNITSFYKAWPAGRREFVFKRPKTSSQ